METLDVAISIAYLLAAAITAYFVRWAFKPLNRIKKFSELGYAARGRFTRAEVADSSQRTSSKGSPPPPFPNGWFAVAESRDLGPGDVAHVAAAGHEWAIFRSSSGEAFALDAYCPHLGAKLAEGGRVVRDSCLRCPFHGWAFRGSDGRCVDIPYTKGAIPEVARTKSWPVSELNGHIYVWVHAEGEEPSYDIPEITQLKDLVYRGRTEHWVATHIEDMPENAGDLPHLNFIHTPFAVRGTRLSDISADFGVKDTGHYFEASWAPLGAPDGHIGLLKARHGIRYRGHDLPFSDIITKAYQIGPAVVHLDLDMGIFGPAVLIHNLLPVEASMIRVQQHFYTSPWIPAPLAKIFLLVDALQMERDVVIWNNKKYVKNPVFVKEDAPIARHRRWYSQFYSPNSYKPRESLDW